MKPVTPDDAARYRAQGHWGDDSLDRIFARNAALAPERIAIVDAPNRARLASGHARRLNYADAARAVDGIAAVLRAHGLGAGSRMLIQLPNIHEMLLLYLACARIGTIISPVPMPYRRHELTQIVDQLLPDAVCGIARFADRAAMQEDLCSLPNAAHCVRFGWGDDLPDGVIGLDAALDAVLDSVLDSVLNAALDDTIDNATAPSPPPAFEPTDPDTIFSICWTSGTEGRPKAVPKTHNNYVASSRAAFRIASLPVGGNVLAAFPFVNAAALGGLMATWLQTGGAMVLHHPFDLDVFVEQLCNEHICYTMVAPTLLVSLKDRAVDPALAGALERLVAMGTGSAPPDPSTFDWFQREHGIAMMNFFGSNEGVQLCSHAARVPDPVRRATMFPRDGDIHWAEGRGRLTANGGTFQLLDQESREPVTEPGCVGEMFIAGPAVFAGYYQRGALVRTGFHDDGSFCGSDLFEIDREDLGLIRFVGRTRELIVRGGMTIAPAELDALLSSHPAVREGGVAGFDDARLGQRVCAFVVLERGAEFGMVQMRAHLEAAGVARYKWPEHLVVLDALPRTMLAKLSRAQLQRHPNPFEPKEA